MVGLFIDDQLLGVACVVSPDFGMSVGRFWHWRLKMLLRAGYMSTKQMIEKEEKLRSALYFERYHMIAFVAIHPNHQQHGLGHQLIQAVGDLVAADASSVGVGVYVTLEKYLDFFNGFDFEYVCDVAVGNVNGQLLFRKSVA